MGRAKLRFLHHDLGPAAAERRFDLFAPVTRDDHLAVKADLPQAAQQVQQHRVTRDGMEDLVQVAFHARALARGKDDDGQWIFAKAHAG